jgi:hypothetical protein
MKIRSNLAGSRSELLPMAADRRVFNAAADGRAAVSWHPCCARQGVDVVKEKKSKKELATLVADAIEAAIGHGRVMPPFIEGHVRDGMGRTWDVSMPAPTPVHRKAIDSVRDRFDLS